MKKVKDEIKIKNNNIRPSIERKRIRERAYKRKDLKKYFETHKM